MRWVLVVMLVILPSIVSAQGFRAKDSRPPRPTPTFTLCVYGDSIVDDDSPTGNQTAGSEGKGVCDWCDPLVEAGITIIAMGWNGAETEDDTSPATVDACSPNYDSCANSGEQIALLEDTNCPSGGLTTSCRDVRGDTTLDSTYMDDMAPYCDVFAFFYGTNDTSESLAGNEFDLVHKAVIEKAASLEKPVVFWEAPPTYINETRYNRLEEYRGEIANAVAAVTADERKYVSVYSAWDLWSEFRRVHGWEAQRSLFDETCNDGWDDADWEAGTNQFDCTHPDRDTVDENLGQIPADWMGGAIMRHLLGVIESFSLGVNAAPPSLPPDSPSNLWDEGVWDTSEWGA